MPENTNKTKKKRKEKTNKQTNKNWGKLRSDNIFLNCKILQFLLQQRSINQIRHFKCDIIVFDQKI